MKGPQIPALQNYQPRCSQVEGRGNEVSTVPLGSPLAIKVYPGYLF